MPHLQEFDGCRRFVYRIQRKARVGFDLVAAWQQRHPNYVPRFVPEWRPATIPRRLRDANGLMTLVAVR